MQRGAFAWGSKDSPKTALVDVLITHRITSYSWGDAMGDEDAHGKGQRFWV